MRIKDIGISFFIIHHRKQNFYCRLNQKGHKVEFSTGLEVDPKLWSHGKFNTRSAKGKNLKTAIDKIQFDLIELIGNIKNATPEKVKARYFGYNLEGNEYHKMGLLEAMEIFQKNNKMAPGTRRNNESLIKITREIIKTTYGIPDLFLVDLEYSHIQTIEKGWEANGSVYSTRINYKSKISKTIRFILENYSSDLYHLPEKNIFESYKIQKSHSDIEGQKEKAKKKKWVDDETLHAIENAWNVSEKHRYALNMWLLQRWTGMSWQELTYFDPSLNITTDLHGNKQIRIQREKTIRSTGKQCIIPLFNETQELLHYFQEYKETHGLRKFIKQHSLTGYRLHLKEVCEKLKIPRITSHQGRHTFAVKMLEMGFSMEAVSEMMGHTSISTTQYFYAEITPSKIQKEYDIIMKSNVKGSKQISSNT